MMLRNLVARIFSEDDETKDNNTSKSQKGKKQRLAKSRNSDWNQVTKDKEIDVFCKVYSGLTKDAAERRLDGVKKFSKTKANVKR